MTFSAVPVVDYSYDSKTKRYADPAAKILDYQNFRERASCRYFKPQIAALRAANQRHLVTISNHSRRAIGLLGRRGQTIEVQAVYRLGAKGVSVRCP